MDFITTNEIAKIWGISTRRITVLCNEGRVQGAVKMGNTWLIPREAKKPEDNRKIKNEILLENGEYK